MKVLALEVPPPGDGVNTVTLAEPLALMSLERIVALTLVEDTNVVVRFDPFQRTTEPLTKFLPLTVKVGTW